MRFVQVPRIGTCLPTDLLVLAIPGNADAVGSRKPFDRPVVRCALFGFDDSALRVRVDQQLRGRHVRGRQKPSFLVPGIQLDPMIFRHPGQHAAMRSTDVVTVDLTI